MPTPNKRFNIFTGILKAYTDEDGRRGFNTIASSTIKDLQGDEISEAAIAKMRMAAEQNMTIFLNHRYDVPEDVLGGTRSATLKSARTDDGLPVIDLHLDVDLEETNPRAVRTWEMIDNGRKLGTSIGAIVKEYHKDKATGSFVIDDIQLLEASIVGIPANPRSWVQYAVKALQGVEPEEAEELPEELEIEKAKKPAPPATHEHPHAHVHNHDHDHYNGISHSHEHAHTHAHEHGDDHEHVDDQQGYEHDHSHDGAYDEDHAHQDDDTHKGVVLEGDELAAHLAEFHKDAPSEDPVDGVTVPEVEPDKLDRTRVTITIDDSGNSPQGAAPAASPESGADSLAAVTDETAPGDDAVLGDDVTRSALLEVPEGLDVETSAMLLKSYRELTEKYIALTEKLADAEKARDEAVENFLAAKEVVVRMSKLPLGRKATFAAEIDNFQKRFSMYDPEFIKMLEK